MEIIRELHSEGTTCILITHFMEEAMQADRVIVLKDGKLFCDRKPEDLFADKALIDEAGLELPPVIELRELAGLPEELTTAEQEAEYIAAAASKRR